VHAQGSVKGPRDLTLLSHTGTLDKLFKYSTVTMSWTQLDAGVGMTRPSARYSHSMATVEQDLYVFGGGE
jgi:hypothetical protein